MLALLGLVVPATADACRPPKKMCKGKCLYPEECKPKIRRCGAGKKWCDGKCRYRADCTDTHGGKMLHKCGFKSKKKTAKTTTGGKVCGWKLGRVSSYCHTAFKGKRRYWMEVVGKSCIQTYLGKYGRRDSVISHYGGIVVSAKLKIVYTQRSSNYIGIMIGNAWTQRTGRRRNYIEFMYNRNNRFVLRQWRYGRSQTHQTGRFVPKPGKKGKVVHLKLQYQRGTVLAWLNGFLAGRASTRLESRNQVGIVGDDFGTQLELRGITIRKAK